MKALLVITPILAIVFTVLTTLGMDLLDESNTEAQNSPVESNFEERLSSVENQMEALNENLNKVIAKLDAVEALSKQKASHVAQGEKGSEEEVKTEIAKASLSNPASKKMKTLLKNPETEGEVRDYVMGLIQHERSERERRRHENVQRRRQEERELREGPYGKYNYRINKMAKKLNLTDWQKDNYNNLLKRYGDERARIRKERHDPERLKGLKGEQIVTHFKTVEKDLDNLNTQFDQEFGGILDAGQREAYNELPKHEKGASSIMGGGAFASTIRMVEDISGSATPSGNVIIHSEVIESGSPTAIFDIPTGSGAEVRVETNTGNSKASGNEKQK